MENTTIHSKNNLVDCIAKIYSNAQESKLNAAFFKKNDARLKVLSQYLNTSKTQALFVAIVFVRNHEGSACDFADITSHTGCESLYWLAYNAEIESLKTLGYVTTFKQQRSSKMPSFEQFLVHAELNNAIINQLVLPSFADQKLEDPLELLEKIWAVGDERDDEELSYFEFRHGVLKLYEQGNHFDIVKAINLLQLNFEDTYMLYYLIWKSLVGRGFIDIEAVSNAMHSSKARSVAFMQSFLNEKNELLLLNLVEMEQNKFANDLSLKLTDKATELLNANGIKITISKQKMDDVLLPESIPLRRLIFSGDEKTQLDLVHKTLKEDKLQKIIQRLSIKNLPKGITILLHGAPGTGKTESVLQIAKATNRQVMKVDVSKSKSAWFGESEKLIKKVFTSYASFAKECQQMPILLFNEADAIFSKRKDVNMGNVAQTENAIQNIILDALENFEGILMATTNLTNNLDSAFDRRFLFKVKFGKPSLEAKQKIWKLKLPQLSKTECAQLAAQFDFSGGQIDNIIRKNEINSIIYATKISFNTIKQFCKEESLEAPKNVIGFNKNAVN
jgi:AAA+ superfamily predicted ATPase